MISFAGGLPAAETFPDFGLAAPDRPCNTARPRPEARERIALEFRRPRPSTPRPTGVLVRSGPSRASTQGKLFVDAGTPVAVESPTYLAALQVFRFFGARFCPSRPKP